MTQKTPEEIAQEIGGRVSTLIKAGEEPFEARKEIEELVEKALKTYATAQCAPLVTTLETALERIEFLEAGGCITDNKDAQLIRKTLAQYRKEVGDEAKR